MSKERFLKAVNLQPVDRVPCNEWIDHPAFVSKLTGIDPFTDPIGAVIKSIRLLEIDWYVSLPRHAYRFDSSGTKKDLGGGHYISEWGFTGSSWTMEHHFHDDEDVLTYNPLELKSAAARQADYGATIAGIKADQALVGENCYISGLYYTTLFQWFILTFGWELFLMTAAAEPERFKQTIARFAELSVEYATYFAQTDLPVFYCHDDLSLTRGLVFAPEWYRANIFPYYERIFEPLKKAGKKVIFVSDGNYSELIDDLIAVGVDGLTVDHFVDIENVLQRYGGKILISGNADITKLTFGTPDDVRRDVARCMAYGRRYPGYVIKVTGDLPHNIPLENIEAYFEACREMGRL
ncbi:MAG: uroporphyrinogen decarboxylase family protein [Clostridiales bacterium]|nr:uroporphyrinogen decarboxylase family protein [Clostridiales bacterium]